MSITQTVEIPDSHRLVIDVPREVPAGRAEIVYFPALKPQGKNEYPLDSLRGIDKGKDTLGAYFERKRADKAQEDAQFEKQLRG